MKKFLLKSMTLLFISMSVVACSEDDSNDDNNNSNTGSSSVDQTIQVATSGNWVITNFIDSGDDETSNFNGYEFTFNSDGTVVATNGNTTVNGTWSVSDSNSSSDDDSIEDDDFILTFPASNALFEDLNDDWDFVSVTNNKIELIDISGGNGGTDYLTFQKQ